MRPEIPWKMAASAGSVLVLALTFGGCGKPAAGPASQTAPPQAKADAPDSRRDPAYLDEVLATWSSGKKEQAIEGFLRIDWQKKATFPRDSLFGLTEKEHVALSAPEQTKRLDQILSLRALCRAVVDTGKSAAAAGKRDDAQRRVEAVARCGRSLAENPNVSVLLQKVGTAIERTASEEMGKLK